MQLELILGYLLIVEYTQLYNSIVYLYEEYKKLYAAINGMLAMTQTTTIDIHDGIYPLEVNDQPLYSRIIGIVDDVVYYSDTDGTGITDGTSTWSIAIAGSRLKEIMKVENGWMAMYVGNYGSPAKNGFYFVKYTDSFVATSTSIIVPNVSRLTAYIKGMIGFDGNILYIYAGRDPDDTDGYNTLENITGAICKIDFTTGFIDFQDSKLGIIWGSNFYPIDGTIIYTSKPIFVPWLSFYTDKKNRYGCVFFSSKTNGVTIYYENKGLFFDGNYLYSVPQTYNSYRLGINGNPYILKKKII